MVTAKMISRGKSMVQGGEQQPRWRSNSRWRSTSRWTRANPGLTQRGEKAKGIELGKGQQIQFIDKGGEAVTGVDDKTGDDRFVLVKGGRNKKHLELAKIN